MIYYNLILRIVQVLISIIISCCSIIHSLVLGSHQQSSFITRPIRFCLFNISSVISIIIISDVYKLCFASSCCIIVGKECWNQRRSFPSSSANVFLNHYEGLFTVVYQEVGELAYSMSSSEIVGRLLFVD